LAKALPWQSQYALHTGEAIRITPWEMQKALGTWHQKKSEACYACTLEVQKMHFFTRSVVKVLNKPELMRRPSDDIYENKRRWLGKIIFQLLIQQTKSSMSST
jgi:hypothetical protein